MGLALMGVVVLLEKVCNCGVGLRSLTYAQVMATETVHFRVPAKCRTLSYLSGNMSACILPCLSMMIMD